MLEPITMVLDGATAAPVPLPELVLDGRPFRSGTVVALLSADREGTPLHSTLVWHARIIDGAWSLAPQVAPRDQQHVTAQVGSRVWVVVTWAGRRLGELRVRVGRG